MKEQLIQELYAIPGEVVQIHKGDYLFNEGQNIFTLSNPVL